MLPLLVSCKGETPEDPDAPEEQLPEIEHIIDLATDGYTIIAPGGDSEEVPGEQDAALKLYTTVYQQTRIKLNYYNDEMDRGADPDAGRTEILVGNTNRAESLDARETLRAKDYLNATTKTTAKTHTFEKATSAILLIGDGMGFNHIDYTLDSNMLSEFVAFDLPNQTSCTTVSQSVIDGDKTYTDSAAAATALATGYKTINGYLGMDASMVNRQNLRELAYSCGARTAVIYGENDFGQ